MAYTYRGTIRDIEEEPQPPSPKCGSRAGYMEHITRGTEKCRPCKDAHAAYMREYKHRPKMRIQCGTYAGYKRHKRGDENPCEMCLSGYAQYMADYRDKRKQSLAPKPPTFQDRLDRAAQLFDDGVSQREVCRTTGLSRDTIRKYFPGKGWSFVQGGELAALNRWGVTQVIAA